MKSNKKVKTKKQMGGGIRFWKKILLGPFWKIGEPKSKTKPKPKSKSKTKSKSKSKSKTKVKHIPMPKSEVDILFKQYKNLTLDQKRVDKLSKKDYQILVEKINMYKRKGESNFN